MVGDIPVEYVASLIAMLVVAAFSALFFRRIGFPITIGLVAVGIGLGLVVRHVDALSLMDSFRITPNVLLYVLLPALLFDAAINMEVALLRRNLVPVLALAAPGLLVATFITATIVSWLTPVAFVPALVFGALISTTDPVAVISLFKELGAPKRLVMLVDGESLFNDATAIVAFQVVLGLLGGGFIGVLAFVGAGVEFTAVFAGGFAIGVLVGWVIVQLLSAAKGDPFVRMTFITIAAYFSFILAQYYLGISGVMAVVGTGMTIAHYSSRFSNEGRQYMKMFWAFASFVTNSFIFLMLGITEFHQIARSGREGAAFAHIGAAILAILVGRMVAVYGIVPLVNRLPKAHKIDLAHQTVMFWGGLRGALPIGLALSLTPEVFGPGGEMIRSTIIEMTFGVVIFTLLVQGTTVKALITRLGLNKPTSVERTARAYGNSVAKKSARRALERLQEEWCLLDEGALSATLKTIALDEKRAEEELAEALDSPQKESEIRNIVFWSEAITLSRQFATRLYDCGFVSEWTMRGFQQNCDHAAEDVQEYDYPPSDLDKMPLRLGKVHGLITKGFDVALSLLHVNRRGPTTWLRRSFEWHSLIAENAVMVDAELARIAQLSGVGRETVANCRRYFEGLHDLSREKLMELRRQHPDAIESLVRETVEKVSAIAEYQAIEQLSETGGISEETADFLLSDLRTRLGNPANL